MRLIRRATECLESHAGCLLCGPYWLRAMNSRAVLFKDTLSNSAQGVSWKEKTYPLNSITRVRWGGVRHSVNGVPTGTDYTVAFGDNRSESVVSIKREATYTKFTEKLWRAVCARLMSGGAAHQGYVF